MKISAAGLLSLSALATTTTTHAFVVGPSSRRHKTTTSLFQSTAVAEATFAEIEQEEIIDPRTLQSRFDRLKQTYKGIRQVVKPDEENDAFGYDEFDAAVAETTYGFNRDEIVAGVVMQHEERGAIVDIGAKASAFLPTQEAALMQAAGSTIADLVPLHAELEFQIISDEDDNGQLLVSLRRLQYAQAWNNVLEFQQNDEHVVAEVVAVNRGGAICLVAGLRAFLPGSHLAGGMVPNEDLIGVKLPLKFLEVNQETSKLVVSHRRAIVEQQMADLSRGDIVEGTVTGLKPYGAFIEVSGMSGLLHISQISYDRIEKLEDVLQPGSPIKCMIIDHDKMNGRIALSTKTLEPEPGDMLKNPQLVYEKAEETGKKYHERMEAERKAREEVARGIVMGLGDSLDDLTGGVASGLLGDDDADDSDDPLASVSDNLDSLLS
eukprot:CAMPEP_0118702396 /NCGR_PEP_ID=MMETSP0800-20121206/17868_1 /TAXON_ID=210618 ORGANISM="Striatella unipunctata, Strain CCMP2910" /NCGR_SAMPLE_ID=MMETSP0800 /ASSEMBLY_ACC=CAM_ASM_000638 /LENGTH=434 /DNA_ID=CAMNT_0006603593 /DNA_START=99 /DNA_END=1403 /DNA_ORIENTATION=-